MIISLILIMMVRTTEFTETTKFTENIQNGLLCLQNSPAFKNFKNTLIIHNSYELINELSISSLKQITKLIFNLYGNYQKLQIFGKINFYVLILKDKTELNVIFTSLKNYNILNANAKYLIIFSFSKEGHIKDSFELCWKYSIINVVIILQEKIFTYYPFENKKCGENITSKLLLNCRDIKSQIFRKQIFPEKVPLDLQGCKIKFSAVTIPPLVINISAPHKNLMEAGLEALIFYSIVKQMNASNEYYNFQNEVWGVRSDNGCYTELYGRLQNREVDILFGYFNAYYEFDLDFDSTAPHLYDITNFWVPVASQIPKWKNIAKIFDIKVWMLLIVLIVTNSIIWRLIAIASKSEKVYFKKLSNSFFTSLYILLQNTLSSPKSVPLRISYYTWCICCTIIYVAYTSKLISFITNPLFENQIDTMDELLNSMLDLGLDPSAVPYLNASNSVDKTILDKYKLCSDFDECLDKMVIEKNMALLTNKKSIHYLIDQKYKSTDANEYIVELKEYGFLDVLRYSVNMCFIY